MTLEEAVIKVYGYRRRMGAEAVRGGLNAHDARLRCHAYAEAHAEFAGVAFNDLNTAVLAKEDAVVAGREEDVQ